MGIVLGPNQYGKAEVRMVHVDRSTDVHRITDVNVTSQLIGDFSATHLTGDNSDVIATDTQKNTVYALARTGGVGTIEDFALRLARTFVGPYPQVTGARMAVEQFGWDRIQTPDGPHDHSFVRGSAEVRTTVVTKDGTDPDGERVISGVRDLVVLKSTGSEFWGFPKVPYTALVETKDRIMATSVTARWVYTGTDLDWDATFTLVRSTMLAEFAQLHSLSLQQTLFAMGRAVLETVPEIGEIRLSMPNKHHFLVDLSAWDLDNPNQVFFAADRPYGLIEAAVQRDDAPVDPAVWQGVPGFV
ncbi:factor-independent urate hydroxylase [Nakamurella leprariae]|uniref:Uricase n=1 Tax=Nakamurella leprariae TaxID=2803911 RepID=A0A938YGU3_9ACTN|nr:urate oxidase [Nakamurella leprariae]MBM9467864.1 urate oxidase [Nakamurella leprariae]